MNREKIYARYVALRDKAGVTDYRVAKDTGVPAATLSDWGKGLYMIKLDKLIALARYFEVSVEYFLED